MQLEFYVEEQSAEAALIYLVPKILTGKQYDFDIHSFRGKHDLLRKLPNRLRAYRYRQDRNWRVIVLVDQDNEDCRALKKRLERIAHEADLTSRTAAGHHQQFQVLNRIAVEELEAWFLGDTAAIQSAYPRIPDFSKTKVYRNPDGIRGTWEALQTILQKYNYHSGGLEKIRAASEITRYMEPDLNRSKSFQIFRDALRAIFTP